MKAKIVFSLSGSLVLIIIIGILMELYMSKYTPTMMEYPIDNAKGVTVGEYIYACNIEQIWRANLKLEPMRFERCKSPAGTLYALTEAELISTLNENTLAITSSLNKENDKFVPLHLISNYFLSSISMLESCHANANKVVLTANEEVTVTKNFTYSRSFLYGVLDISKENICWIGQITNSKEGTKDTDYLMFDYTVSAISPDGSLVAVGGGSGRGCYVEVRNIKSGEVIYKTIIKNTVETADLVFDNQNNLYLGDSNGGIYFLPSGQKNLEKFTDLGGPYQGSRITRIGVAPDNTSLVIGTGSEGKVYVLNLKSKKIIGKPIYVDSSPITGFAFNSDGSRLAVITRLGKGVSIYNTKDVIPE